MDLYAWVYILVLLDITTAISCPTGWDTYQASCYKIFEVKKIFCDAEIQCMKYNGHLASIDTNNFDHLQTFVSNFDEDDILIGLYQNTNNRQPDPPKYLYWTDGSNKFPAHTYDFKYDDFYSKGVGNAKFVGVKVKKDFDWEAEEVWKEHKYMCRIKENTTMTVSSAPCDNFPTTTTIATTTTTMPSTTTIPTTTTTLSTTTTPPTTTTPSTTTTLPTTTTPSTTSTPPTTTTPSTTYTPSTTTTMDIPSTTSETTLLPTTSSSTVGLTSTEIVTTTSVTTGTPIADPITTAQTTTAASTTSNAASTTSGQGKTTTNIATSVTKTNTTLPKTTTEKQSTTNTPLNTIISKFTASTKITTLPKTLTKAKSTVKQTQPIKINVTTSATTISTNSPVSTVKPSLVCQQVNLTPEETKKRLEYVEELLMDEPDIPKEVKATEAKYAAVVASFPIGFCCGVLGIFIFLDIAMIPKDIRKLKKNIRNARKKLSRKINDVKPERNSLTDSRQSTTLTISDVEMDEVA